MNIDKLWDKYSEDFYISGEPKFKVIMKDGLTKVIAEILSSPIEPDVIKKIAEAGKEIARLLDAVGTIKGTAGACTDAEVHGYGLFEYCQKILDESNFSA